MKKEPYPTDKLSQPEDFKTFIAQKHFDKWAKENQTFIQDIQNLIHEMMMFEIKYGTKILYEIDKTPPQQSRELGKEFVDIIDAQAFTNKLKA